MSLREFLSSLGFDINALSNAGLTHALLSFYHLKYGSIGSFALRDDLIKICEELLPVAGELQSSFNSSQKEMFVERIFMTACRDALKKHERLVVFDMLDRISLKLSDGARVVNSDIYAYSAIKAMIEDVTEYFDKQPAVRAIKVVEKRLL